MKEKKWKRDARTRVTGCDIVMLPFRYFQVFGAKQTAFLDHCYKLKDAAHFNDKNGGDWFPVRDEQLLRSETLDEEEIIKCKKMAIKRNLITIKRQKNNSSLLLINEQRVCDFLENGTYKKRCNE